MEEQNEKAGSADETQESASLDDLMDMMKDIFSKVDESDAEQDKKDRAKAAAADILSMLAQKMAADKIGKDYEPPAETIHLEDTERFFESIFHGKGTVWHEIVSEKVHIDVHVTAPTEERPYYVLYTTGMSDLPMTVPEEFTEEQKKKLSYAELMMLLPKDWQVGEEEFKDEKWYWPVRVLKSAARYPHICETWIGHCHDIQFTEPCEPFADNTKLCALMFAYPPEEKMRCFTADDGSLINIYCCIPIYEEEMQEKISDDEGGSKLLEKLFGEGDVLTEQLVVDINRKNVSI